MTSVSDDDDPCPNVVDGQGMGNDEMPEDGVKILPRQEGRRQRGLGMAWQGKLKAS